MINNVNIKDVLNSLFSGYSFRSKVENDPKGNVKVIQMKDLENNYSKIGSKLTQIDASTIPTKYLLQKGDILFITKGSNNFAIVYDLGLPKAVGSSAFFVLRPDMTKINPDYLAWYINQEPVQQYLINNRAGTYIPNINRDTVEGIKIELPEIKTQKLISKISQLQIKEKRIMENLIFNRNLLVKNILFQKLYNRG